MTFYRVGVDLQPSTDVDRELAAQLVRLWDIGPTRPVAPAKPKLPHGKDGDPEYELARLEFREALEDYADALRRYGQEKKDYAKFQRDWGGPYELVMHSVDARDALINHGEKNKNGLPPRYYVKDRRLANDGLPEGAKPGHGHHAMLARRAAGEAEFEEQRRKDPQFGDRAQGVAA